MAYRRYRKRKYKKSDNLTIILFVIIVLLLMNKDKINSFNNLLNNIFIIVLIVGILIITGFILIKFFKYKKRKDFLNRKYTINQLLNLYKDKPTDFEYYIANLYKKMGYRNVKVTPPSNDGGKDIVMTKDVNKYFVEVKLYNHHNLITREQLQKFHSACEIGKAKGIFITTSNYKKTAINWALKCNIKLINGQDLTKLIKYSNNQNT